MTEKYTTLDSGEREDYSTGARRDVRTEKGRYDLLQVFAIRRIAGVLERGAAKYGDRNFEKGIPLMRYIDSGLRHTFEVIEGKTDEDHAAQAAWNLLSFIQTEEMIKRGILPASLDDRPVYNLPVVEPTPPFIPWDSYPQSVHDVHCDLTCAGAGCRYTGCVHHGGYNR